MDEVYALKYAEWDATSRQLFHREASHAPLTLHYYVCLSLGGSSLGQEPVKAGTRPGGQNHI